jgi:hypothetical protein
MRLRLLITLFAGLVMFSATLHAQARITSVEHRPPSTSNQSCGLKLIRKHETFSGANKDKCTPLARAGRLRSWPPKNLPTNSWRAIENNVNTMMMPMRWPIVRDFK